jgi:hypothetical protein
VLGSTNRLLYLAPRLILQQTQEKIADGIWRQATRVKRVGGADLVVGLEHVGHLCEDVGRHTVAIQVLEEQEGLEWGVD